MCGIVGYVGKNSCRDFVLEGLARLEYRGYDSTGFACIDSEAGKISFSKSEGRLLNLRKKLENLSYNGSIGIGHTRWATHGIVNDANAHPHFDCTMRIALIHNGIIEGHSEIKSGLLSRNHRFNSATDSEAVAHLLEEKIELYRGDLKAALVDVVSQLEGAYVFVIMLEAYPDQLIVVRHRPPLAIGIGENEMFVASDPLVFSDKTRKVLFLPDRSFAFIKAGSVELFDFSGKELSPVYTMIDSYFITTHKDGFEHYMLKEIYEQKQAIERTLSLCKKKAQENNGEVLWKELGISPSDVASLRAIHIVAAGTSWHAGRIAQFFFESVCHIPTRVYLASEFRYMPFFPEVKSLFIVISQSGETADTLEALRLINSANIPSLVLSNVSSSSMVREAIGFLLTAAGPEIAVASTKAFSTQLAALYWLAHRFAFEKKLLSREQLLEAEDDLLIASEVMEAAIESYKHEIIQNLAARYARYDRFIFLGRHISYPFALEAALKLKEISYIFAQCYPSGELKHGPIALIDEKTPVLLFSNLDPVIYQKLLSNAQEVKARKGHLVVFAFEGQTDLVALADYAFVIPCVKPLLGPLAMTGLMQFFVYQITKVLGHPIDKPRNLAKSVTVE